MKHELGIKFFKFLMPLMIFILTASTAVGITGIHIRLKTILESFIENNGCHDHLNNQLPNSGSRMTMACFDAFALLDAFNHYEKFDSKEFETKLINFLYHLSDEYQKRDDWHIKKITLRLTPNNRLFQNDILNPYYTSGWEKIAYEKLNPNSKILQKDPNFKYEKDLLTKLNNRITYNAAYMRRNVAPVIRQSLTDANDILRITRMCDFSFCDEETREWGRQQLLFNTIALKEISTKNKMLSVEQKTIQKAAYDLQSELYNQWRGKQVF